jgi:hypothetical protein
MKQNKRQTMGQYKGMEQVLHGNPKPEEMESDPNVFQMYLRK